MDEKKFFVDNVCFNSMPFKKTRVAVLISSYDCSDSVFKPYDYQCVDVNPYNPSTKDYSFENIMIQKPTAVEQVTNLVLSDKYDIFINICDGEPGGDTAGIEVVECLESLKVPYSGANPKFYSLTKSDMKSVANSCDVPTPSYSFVLMADVNSSCYVKDRCKEIGDNLEFPMIVKHYNGGGSLGMTENSKVHNKDELEAEVERTVKEFGGALVEEFVKGREFTVLVAENPYDANDPTAYEPVECLLPSADAFKHFHQKFIDYQSMEWVPVNDAHLANNLKTLAKKAFVGCQANSFARCDFRMCEKTGTIHFLEINANCGVFYYPKDSFGSADFILDLCKGHQDFVENLLLCALINFEKNHNLPPPCVSMPRLKNVQIEQPPVVHTFADEIIV